MLLTTCNFGNTALHTFYNKLKTKCENQKEKETYQPLWGNWNTQQHFLTHGRSVGHDAVCNEIKWKKCNKNIYWQEISFQRMCQLNIKEIK